MKDIELARKILKREGRALVIVKNVDVIYKSNERGIKPMYLAVTEYRDKLAGASLADKVIGKAAALLAISAEIKEIYALLISEVALEILKEKGIAVSYQKKTAYIKNRDQTDMCPVEKLSQGITEQTVLLKKIAGFLAANNLL